MSDAEFEQRIRDEVDFARALTALLLAARLEDAEARAQRALQRILSGRNWRHRFGAASSAEFPAESLAQSG